MPFNIGTTAAKKVFWGTAEVKKIFSGTTLYDRSRYFKQRGIYASGLHWKKNIILPADNQVIK